jgi:hypothetical protein
MKLKNILFVLAIFSCLISAAQPVEGFSTDADVGDFYRKINNNYYLSDQAGSHLSTYIFNNVDMNTYELVAANVSLSDKDQVVKISISPFKFIPGHFKCNFLQSTLKENFRLQLSQSKTNTTAGVSIGYSNNSPFSKRAANLRNIYFSGEAYSPALGETKADYLKRLKQKRVNYIEALNKSVYKLSLGYTNQMFAVFSSRQTYVDTTKLERDTTNYYLGKSQTISVSGNYTYTGTKKHKTSFSILGSLNYILTRQNAQKIKGKEQVPFLGYSVGFNYRIAKFIKTDELKDNVNYIKSAFIPAMYIGLTYESQATSVEKEKYIYIEEGVKKKTAFTPNIDFCITPALQFRIAVPIVRTEKVDGAKGISAGGMLQYTFKLSNLTQ